MQKYVFRQFLFSDGKILTQIMEGIIAELFNIYNRARVLFAIHRR